MSRSIRSFLLWRLVGGAALVLLAAGTSAYLLLARGPRAPVRPQPGRPRAGLRLDPLPGRGRGLLRVLRRADARVRARGAAGLLRDLVRRRRAPRALELPRRARPGAAGRGRHRAACTGARRCPTGGQERPGRYVAQRLEIHHVYPEEGPERPEAQSVLVAIARGREELAAAEAPGARHLRGLLGPALAPDRRLGLDRRRPRPRRRRGASLRRSTRRASSACPSTWPSRACRRSSRRWPTRPTT